MTPPLENAALTAGTAKVCITPPVGTWQGGYGARSRPCAGIHDDLYARAVVFGDGSGAAHAAIVSVDIVGLPHDVANGARQRAAAATGIPAAHIALCASHTHGGPATYGYLVFRPEPDPEYLQVLEKQLAGVVIAGAQELRPATVRLGHGHASFAVNRRRRNPDGSIGGYDPEGAVDRDVAVIRVDPAEPETGGSADPSGSAASAGAIVPGGRGKPMAVLFRYACHATAIGGGNYHLTADYPGAAAAVLEQVYGGKTLGLFLQGCAGNVRPYMATTGGGRRSATWDEVAALGRELGAAAIAAAEAAPLAGGTPPGGSLPAIAAACNVIALPFAPAPSAAELRRMKESGTWLDGGRLREVDRAWIDKMLEGQVAGTLPKDIPAEVQVFRLGFIWLVTLPGEVFVEIGWQVRDAVAAAAGASPDHVVVAAYSNGNVGYVPTATAIEEGGYEPNAYRHAGRPGVYVAEAGDLLARAAAELARSMR